MKRVWAILFSMTVMAGCVKTSEPQSVLIEFRFRNPDETITIFNKTISFTEMESGSNYSNYECTVDFENQTYRVGFWAHSYPKLPVSAVDIRYNFGNTLGGTGLAIPYETFNAYNDNSGIRMEFFSTKLLASLTKEYPNSYKNNLNCQTF